MIRFQTFLTPDLRLTNINLEFLLCIIEKQRRPRSDAAQRWVSTECSTNVLKQPLERKRLCLFVWCLTTHKLMWDISVGRY